MIMSIARTQEINVDSLKGNGNIHIHTDGGAGKGRESKRRKEREREMLLFCRYVSGPQLLKFFL